MIGSQQFTKGDWLSAVRVRLPPRRPGGQFSALACGALGVFGVMGQQMLGRHGTIIDGFALTGILSFVFRNDFGISVGDNFRWVCSFFIGLGSRLALCEVFRAIWLVRNTISDLKVNSNAAWLHEMWCFSRLPDE